MLTCWLSTQCIKAGTIWTKSAWWSAPFYFINTQLTPILPFFFWVLLAPDSRCLWNDMSTGSSLRKCHLKNLSDARDVDECCHCSNHCLSPSSSNFGALCASEQMRAKKVTPSSYDTHETCGKRKHINKDMVVSLIFQCLHRLTHE